MNDAIPTAAVSDACLRVNCPVRVAPPGIKPLNPAWLISGPVRPSQHYGSVDIFLEAIEAARASDVLVIDNQGRSDEACIGDLVTLEAKLASLQGIVIWGLNRDSTELLALDLPVFSYGSVPPGPARLDQRRPDGLTRAQFGHFEVTAEDWVVGDADGVLFFPQKHRSEVFPVAQEIWSTERGQVSRAKKGESLREQFQFREFLRRRQAEPEYTFRAHLRRLSRSIEE